MKQMMSMVILAGFLVLAADLEASERRVDRLKAREGKGRGRNAPVPQVALRDGPQLAGAADFTVPPPAPAFDGSLPPGPTQVLPGPAPPAAMPMPEGAGPGPGPGPGSGLWAPGPAPEGSVTLPMPAAGGPPVPLALGGPLYPRVKYRDVRHIAPCAVPMCVAVRDPCEHRDRCGCGPSKCVLVEICVPPGACPKVTCKHDGARLRYDYGKYAVNITSRHGVVVVNYD